ncbi:MAG TPA: hypothetical protein VK553_04915, partial [Candidatus Nitrosopolaris rasttigaisensis]|nr:hypothetical protein [Candidatus Nitrosopolaris rasttigaisensis]
PKLLPGQTTSDATILQPNSPGRIESQDTNENALLAAHEKIALNPLMTSDNTIGKFIRLVKKSGQMRPLEDLQEIALDLLKNKGSFSKGFQIGNRLNDDEHSLTSCMVRLALSHDPSLETADKRKYSNALVYQSQRAYENRHPKKEPVELNLIDVPPSS